MHPAWSIIFFTTVSGLGFGFSAWIVFGLIDIKNIFQLIIIAGFAFCLICSGLVSSTFHLGHPERAWRAFSQWSFICICFDSTNLLVFIYLSIWETTLMDQFNTCYFSFIYSLRYGYDLCISKNCSLLEPFFDPSMLFNVRNFWRITRNNMVHVHDWANYNF